MRIGLPRALLYYWFGPAWKVFFQEINQNPVVSSITNKEILKEGAKVAVDEACLPVKIFFGHCLSLIKDCDRILVPRFVNLMKNEYICPKFMGLPDMTLRIFSHGDRRRDMEKIMIWKSDHKSLWDTLPSLPPEIYDFASKKRIKAGLDQARKTYDQYKILLHKGYLPSEAEDLLDGKMVDPPERNKNEIGFIGHPYCLYDGFLNLELLDLLRKGDYDYRVLTPEMFSDQEVTEEIKDISKPVFWTLGKKMLGTARALRKKRVAGLIHIAAFACGPEALIGELIRRECNAAEIPLLQLHIDEHSGEAGLLTRVEAFLDLINARAKRKERIKCG